MLSWECHISTHAASFLSQGFSTATVSWWLGYVRAHPPSALTVHSLWLPNILVLPARAPSCWCGHAPCQCCDHPRPPLQSSVLLLPLGKHKLSRSKRSASTLASHSHHSVSRNAQRFATGFGKCSSYHSVIKSFAHSTPTGEEGPISLRLQACMGNNVIRSQQWWRQLHSHSCSTAACALWCMFLGTFLCSSSIWNWGTLINALIKKLSVHAFFARTCSEGLSFSQEHNKANDKQFGF